MQLLLIFSLCSAVAFPAVAAWRAGRLPDSISAMVYVLSGDWRWIWTIWLWTVAFTLAPALIDAMPSEWKVLAFLTVASLVVCGSVPLFAGNGTMHTVSAVAAGILSQICVAFICPWCLTAWVAYLIGLRLYEGKAMFAAEAVCAMTTYAALLIRAL